MILTKEGQKEFLKSRFHQFFDIKLKNIVNIDYESTNDSEINFELLNNNTDIEISDNVNNYLATNGIDKIKEESIILQPVNFVLPISELNDKYDMEALKKYFNPQYNNVIFTPSDNYDIIYDYECYQQVYFIKMSIFSNNIRMHIVPKKYDASNTKTNPILFFKDNEVNITEGYNFFHSDNYNRDEDIENNVNLVYNNNNADNQFGFYKFDIKKHTKYFNNLQINLGYKYNTIHTPDNKVWHITGIIDESNEGGQIIPSSQFTEWNSCLVDGNVDNYGEEEYSNKILQQTFISQEQEKVIDWDNLYEHSGGFINSHIPIDPSKDFHKTLKYFNDDLYIEENKKFHIVEWEEIIEG